MSVRVLPKSAPVPVRTFEWPSLERAPLEPDAATGAQPASRDAAGAADRDLLAEIERVQAELQAANEAAERRVAEAFQHGVQAGDKEAREAFSRQAEELSSRLAQLIDQFTGMGPAIRQQAEEDVVRLAIAIARRILHRELHVDREALEALVKTALAKVSQREIHRIATDPESLPIVEQIAGAIRANRRIEVVADGALKPGSLVIETTRGHLDASIDAQLQEIQRGFADMVSQR